MKQNDTIAAVATPVGMGGVAVIRVSGRDAEEVLERVFPHGPFSHGQMVYGSIKKDGALLDMAMGVLFRAPRSYTGETVAEIHCHGSAVGVQNLLDYIIVSGARPAEPGEFTRRAFLNGKMDLSQAEAVCDFISASSQAGARASLNQLTGKLKERVLVFQNALTNALAQTEAAVEYPEEDLEEQLAEELLPMFAKMREDILSLVRTFRQGRLAREGLRIAITGKPNVGKSSLLNMLTGVDRAIVADVPGTTRDTIEQSMELGGIMLYLTDTAGIRSTKDFIEKQGVKRSENAINESKLAIFVLDGSGEITPEDENVMRSIKKSGAELLIVLNKSDASESLSETAVKDRFGVLPLRISAKTGEGIEALKQQILEFVKQDATSESILITNERHLYALTQAAKEIGDAISAMEAGADMDCVTIDLNAAWLSLGEITGKTVSEEIIDRIFENFCLGK